MSLWLTAGVRTGEGGQLVRCAACFTLLLFSYYLIRPVRDGLVASLGGGEIKYLSGAVFLSMLLLVPLFGACVARLRRDRLLAVVLLFFATNLLCFALLFAFYPHAGWPARVFYVWVTVFNMAAVSVFWSTMADLWREDQGRRLFGLLSAGGSLGGVLAPLLAHRLALAAGLPVLIGIAAACLALAVAPTFGFRGAQGESRAAPLGGPPLEGLTLLARVPFVTGIAALVALGSLLGMLVYIEMAQLVRLAYPDPEARTAFFASRDLWVNGAAFALQVALLGPLATRIGVGRTLLLGALLATAGFLAIAGSPTLATLTAVNVLLRVTEFGVGKPARDMLYTVVEPNVRYKAKNVIDTAVYRLSDTLSAWAHDALAGLGVLLAGFGWIGAAVGAGLAATAVLVGHGYRRRGGR
jgi:AAA family ATP:ADP antiporter